MSKKRIFSLIIIAIILGSVLTNPPKEKHEQAVKEKAKQLLKDQLNYEHTDALQLGMTLFGDKLVDNFIQSSVIVENYYLFSLTKIKWQSNEQIIGGGAFSKVWLSTRIDNEADKIIRILKDL